jgi:nucleotide-binding universal stress UspA family protein
MFKKILFPTDGSENSQKAISYVIDLAKKYNSEVIILHSHELSGIVYSPAGAPNYYSFDVELENELFSSCKQILQAKEKELKDAGVTLVKTILEKGNAGSSILKIIENENCDLVVIGSRGLGTIKSLLLGSVSNYVIHHTQCPVLLIN